jgi:hypothetical protein
METDSIAKPCDLGDVVAKQFNRVNLFCQERSFNEVLQLK